MATLTCHTTRSDGVTLVELVVTSDVRECVRVENCLDGPVWPPRRQGVPEAGWTEDGYEDEVGPEDRLVAGYATPAEPCEPPARLVSADGSGEETTPDSLVRTLGDPRPPREGVTLTDSTGSPGGEDPVEGTTAETDRDGDETAHQSEGKAERSTAEADADEADSPHEVPATSRPPVDGEELPPGFDAYLARVRERLDEAEGLAGPSTAGEASAALAAVGGPEEAAAMQEQLAADRERLARLGTECQRLAARIDAVEVPVETLARLT